MSIDINDFVMHAKFEKALIDDNVKALVSSAKNFIDLFQEEDYQKKASEDDDLLSTILRINNVILSGTRIHHSYFNGFLLPYLNMKNAINFKSIYSDVVSNLFRHINENQYQSGLELFLSLSKNFSKLEFTNTKAYALYYAYNLKKYDLVEDIIENNFSYLNLKSSKYLNLVEFSMLHFYRGLVFLSRKNFFNASIAFLACTRYRVKKNLFNSFQLEAIRRLLLLTNIVDSNLRKIINEFLSSCKDLLVTKLANTYEEFNKILNNKNSKIREIERFYNENKVKFSDHKTKGLALLCVKNAAYSKICENLKFYKRIKIEKLSNITDIERNELVRILKILQLKNMINLRYDEPSGIIELHDIKYDENLIIQNLMDNYENINKIQKEMVEFSIDKNFNMDEFKTDLLRSVSGNNFQKDDDYSD